MNLKSLIKSKARIITFLLVLALVFNTSIRLIFFSSSKEIVYHYEPTLFSCSDNRRCSFYSTLTLANTGSKSIDKLEISMPKLPKTVRSSFRFLNLSSTQPRLNDPIMSDNNSETTRVVTLNDLSPGVLIYIDFKGSLNPVKNKSLPKNFTPSLHADAKIHEGSPRGTAFSRIFSILLWF